MDRLAQDLRYVARLFARTPGFFLVTSFTLALGLGATTAIFSVVDGVLLQPLPYAHAEQIVQLFQTNRDGKRESVTEPNFADWHAGARSFSAMTMTSVANREPVTGLPEPVNANVAYVSRDFFAVFHVAPELGRPFGADEWNLADPRSVIVSDAFWRAHLNADPSIIGHAITVGTTPVVVVGVMPPPVAYPTGADLWLPHDPDLARSRTSGGWRAIARLRDGVTLPQARAEVSSLSRRLKQQYGDETGMSDAEVVELREQLVGKTRPTLLVLLGASAFLLVIACANVVNLLVARMSVRQGEIGVRLALGATRSRVARQVVTEAAVVALTGGALGIGLAVLGVRLLLTLQTGSLPRAGDVHVRWPELLFAVLLSLLAALALGLLTAWHATRGDIRESLSASRRTQAGSGSASGVRRTLVIAQMALTVVLLVGAGLLGRSFLHLLELDPGYRTHDAVVLDAELPYERTPDFPARRLAFYQELLSRLRVLPGVDRVGAISGFPLVGGGSDGSYLVLTRPDEALGPADFPRLRKDPARSGTANFYVVAGDYFAAMDIPLLEGRRFESGDSPASAHVAVVSRSFALARWPHESAIGKYIQYGNMDGDLHPFRIVGIVGDVRDQSLAAPPTPTFYVSEQQRTNAGGPSHVVMRTRGDPTSVVAGARGIVRALRPDVPVVVRTMETVVSASVADRRFTLVLVGVFGGTALLLATLGVYSVVSYLVTQRRQEIGVRIALGAQRRDVLSLVLGQGAALALVGIGVGALGALLLTRLIRGLVYDTSTTDPVAFGLVIALLVGVALLASWLPARRAARVDPITVLRS